MELFWLWKCLIWVIQFLMFYYIPFLVLKKLDMNYTVPDVLLWNYFGRENAWYELYSSWWTFIELFWLWKCLKWIIWWLVLLKSPFLKCENAYNELWGCVWSFSFWGKDQILWVVSPWILLAFIVDIYKASSKQWVGKGEAWEP